MTQKELDYFLALKPEDVTKSLLIDVFANTTKGEAKYLPNEKITIPAGSMKNDKPIETTIGRLLFNKICMEEKLLGVIGYMNHELTGDGIKKLTSKIDAALIKDQITTKDYIRFINKLHWLAFSANSFLCTSISYNLIRPNPAVMKRKKELLKEKAEFIANNDILETTAMEKELVELARKELDKEPAMDLYRSQAKGKFENTYKNTSIMKGSQKDTNQGGYVSTMSNYMDGVSKEEYDLFANALIYGQYSKSVGPRKAGYLTKQYFSSFQSVVLDKEGTDCGTEQTLKFELDKSTAKFVLYKYIKKGNSLILLTPDNIEEHYGVVNMRSPLFCTSPKICSKCSGELFHILKIQNAGLTTTKISTRMLEMNMKNFHNTTIETTRINWKQYIE